MIFVYFLLCGLFFLFFKHVLKSQSTIFFINKHNLHHYVNAHLELVKEVYLVK